MMSPLEGGDAWPGDAAASASAAEGYSAPIRVIGIISATAHSLGAGRRGRPNARPAGSLVRRTTTTSAAPFTSPATGPGERVIPAIGARLHTPAMRIKTSQQRKLLVPLINEHFYALTATRSLNGATCCSDWLNCPSRRDSATRRHRPHHRPFVTSRPRHSRHVARPTHAAALTAEAVVIDYETYARIRDCRDRQGLTITQIARTLGLHRETVAKWLARS